MSSYAFRYLCGLSVLFTHLCGFIILITAERFSDITDQVGSILILAPLTLVYASAFLKFVINNPHEPSKEASERFGVLPAITMYLVIAAFCGSLIFVLIKFVYLSSWRVNEFKMWLGAAETAFGALIGVVFERLFGLERGGSAPARNAPISETPTKPETPTVQGALGSTLEPK